MARVLDQQLLMSWLAEELVDHVILTIHVRITRTIYEPSAKGTATENPSFHYAFQYDCEEQITNIFRADAKMIIDYANFGDVVSFDTTFGTNKEYRPFGVFVGFNHFRGTIILVLAYFMMRHLILFDGFLRHFFQYITRSNLELYVLIKTLQWETR